MHQRRTQIIFLIALPLIFAFLWAGSATQAQTPAQAQAGSATPTATATATLTPTPSPTPIPFMINYQGTLRDSTGKLLNGTYYIRMRIYDQASEGNKLHEETFNSLVRDGIFNVVLGDEQPLDASVFDQRPLYIGVAAEQGVVGGTPVVSAEEDMLPRQRFHMVPWAIRAAGLIPGVAFTAGDVVADTLKVNKNVTTGVLNATTVNSSELKLGDGAVSIAWNGEKNSLDIKATAPALSIAENGDVVVLADLKSVVIRQEGPTVTPTPTNTPQPGFVVAVPTVATSATPTPTVMPTPTQVPYERSLRRYEVTAHPFQMVAVDETLLGELCGDEDGCMMSLVERNHWPEHEGLVRSLGPLRFGMSTTVSFTETVNGETVVKYKRFWQLWQYDGKGWWGNNPTYDFWDGNNSYADWFKFEPVGSSCALTDGDYIEKKDSAGSVISSSWKDDAKPGFSVRSADAPASVTCTLIIDD